MLALLNILDIKQDPDALFHWLMAIALEIVVVGMLIGALIGVVTFWRKQMPPKQRAVIGAFAGFFISIAGVVVLLICSEALRYLML